MFPPARTSGVRKQKKRKSDEGTGNADYPGWRSPRRALHGIETRSGRVTGQGTRQATAIPAETAAAYRLQEVEPKSVDAALLGEWEAFLERHPNHEPIHNPRWLREETPPDPTALRVYLLFRGDELCGVAPVLRQRSTFRWKVGEITIAKPPVTRLCLLGGLALFPHDPAAYEMLMDRLLASGDWHALLLDAVPTESPVWAFATGSANLRRRLTPYVPERTAPHLLLPIAGDFEAYMGRFSAKHRKNLRRMIRLLQEAVPDGVQFVRITRPDEVDFYLRHAIALSRKTYQWNLLGLGLRLPELLRQRLEFQAANGWLRCYLLFCKEEPVSFIQGFQYAGRYYLDDMGYDPEWATYSAGKVLHLDVIEDLFRDNSPDIYDLGEYGPHKDEFASEQYLQGRILLFRRGLYPAFLRLGHRAARAGTALSSLLLERLGWKKALKKIIRMWSSRSGRGPQQPASA